LNNLGQRDASVLASHFRLSPGQLNVRRGSESEELYDKRVKKVVEYMRHAGVPAQRISIKDLPAGGDGMASTLMIKIIEADASGYSKPTTGSDPMDKPTIYSGGAK
jgi:hypothetical protein